jgi:hypothetical protein
MLQVANTGANIRPAKTPGKIGRRRSFPRRPAGINTFAGDLRGACRSRHLAAPPGSQTQESSHPAAGPREALPLFFALHCRGECEAAPGGVCKQAPAWTLFVLPVNVKRQ